MSDFRTAALGRSGQNQNETCRKLQNTGSAEIGGGPRKCLLNPKIPADENKRE